LADLHGWDDNKNEAERCFDLLKEALPLAKDEAMAFFVDETGHSPQYCRSYIKVWLIRKKLVERDGLIYPRDTVRKKKKVDEKAPFNFDKNGHIIPKDESITSAEGKI
jgi:hypothetical protein